MGRPKWYEQYIEKLERERGSMYAEYFDECVERLMETEGLSRKDAVGYCKLFVELTEDSVEGLYSILELLED
jgi:hypothetical protein